MASHLRADTPASVGQPTSPADRHLLQGRGASMKAIISEASCRAPPEQNRPRRFTRSRSLAAAPGSPARVPSVGPADRLHALPKPSVPFMPAHPIAQVFCYRRSLPQSSRSLPMAGRARPGIRAPSRPLSFYSGAKLFNLFRSPSHPPPRSGRLRKTPGGAGPANRQVCAQSPIMLSLNRRPSLPLHHDPRQLAACGSAYI